MCAEIKSNDASTKYITQGAYNNATGFMYLFFLLTDVSNF